MLYIIIGILLFGLLIAVHEGGHFLAAKKLDVQVNEFAIGMGPALFSKQKGETLYSLRLFPVGGYCAMEGEDGQDPEEGKEPNPRAFSCKAPWKKIVILAAGSVCNYIAGFLLVALLFVSAGSYVAPVLSNFMEGFPCAGEDGLQAGDRIVAVNGHPVEIYAEVAYYLSRAGEGPKDLVVERNGEEVVLEDLPLDKRDYLENGKTVHMYGFYFTSQDVTLPGLLHQSWHTCLYFARSVWSGLGMLVTGQVGLNDMSGPVGIVTYLGEAGENSASVSDGLRNVCYFIALIAVNLAIMNMLPIPALDGGRIFFLLLSELWWLVTRRTLDPKYEAWLHTVGFLLLMLLMVAVTFSDIGKLIP